MNIPNSMSFLQKASMDGVFSDIFSTTEDVFAMLSGPLADAAADYVERVLISIEETLDDEEDEESLNSNDLHNVLSDVLKNNPVYQGLSDNEFALTFWLYGKIFNQAEDAILTITKQIVMRKVLESFK